MLPCQSKEPSTLVSRTGQKKKLFWSPVSGIPKEFAILNTRPSLSFTLHNTIPWIFHYLTESYNVHHQYSSKLSVVEWHLQRAVLLSVQTPHKPNQ